MNTYTPAIASPSIRAESASSTRAEIFSSIVLMMVFVAILSMFIFSGQSLRLDESQSLWQTSHSVPTIMQIVAQDTHVPFYHMLLHLWQASFGGGVATARMLSLLFYLLVIPAVYFLGRLVYGSSIGLFAAFLVTISPFLNWYGNEVRMYTIFTLVTVLNQYFFMCLFMRRDVPARTRQLYWMGYAITMYVGMFTHYFFVFNIATQALFFVLYREHFPKRAFRKFLVIMVIAAIIFAPWAWYVISQGAASNTQPQLSKPTSIDIFNTFSQFLFGFQNDYINTILVSLWPLLVLLIFLSLRRHQRVTPQTIYLFFSLFVPLLLAYSLSVTIRPVYLTRYLILSLPSLYLLLSWVLTVYSERLSRLIRFGLVVVMLLTLGIEIVNANTPVKEDYRTAAIYLNNHVTPQDVVVISAPFTIYPVEYYYRGRAELKTLPIWDQTTHGPIPAFSEENLPEQVNTLKGSHQVLWLLLSYDQGYEEKIRLYFDTHFERVERLYFSPDLNLFAYRLRYDVADLNKILSNIEAGRPARSGNAVSSGASPINPGNLNSGRQPYISPASSMPAVNNPNVNSANPPYLIPPPSAPQTGSGTTSSPRQGEPATSSPPSASTSTPIAPQPPTASTTPPVIVPPVASTSPPIIIPIPPASTTIRIDTASSTNTNRRGRVDRNTD